MKQRKNLVFYLVLLFIFGGLIYWIVMQGFALQSTKALSGSNRFNSESSFTFFIDSFVVNLSHPLARLILQIITIIFVSRILGFLFNKIGQPTVIGEIVAGIILGPSLIGSLVPEFSAFVFPPSSLANLQFLSQVGLILFMFVIGMELDLKVLKNQAQDAVVISHASIVFPYFLGMGLAYFLYEDFAPSGIAFLPFSLFMGIAMSITAFPVLARIIQERGLSKTRLGNIAITAAASDDVTAWCLLAVVIAIVKAGSVVSSLFTIGLAIIYVLGMLLVIRPILKRIGAVYSNREVISKPVVALSFLVLLASAYVAEIIGIHALFGAFLAGVIMPPAFSFRKILSEKVEDVSLVLLLPLFFVYTGLRTQIGLLDSTDLWIVCGYIIITAVVGKFGGSALAARFVGQSWKDSFAIGALMNTRGLMELIVLNIGYDLGVLTPEVFAMMVIMALATTFMTGPALNAIEFFTTGRKKREAPQRDKFYDILLCFGPAIKGKKLLRLANQLTANNRQTSNITAMHLTPSADINPKDAREYEHEAFRLVIHEAENLGVPVKTLYKATNDISREITGEANKSEYDLLLVGGSRSVFNADVVGGKVRNYLEETRCQVGVLVDKDFEVADRILVMLHDFSDLFLISFAERFVQNNNAKVVISDPGRLVKMNTIFRMAVEKINHENGDRIEVVEGHSHQEDFFSKFNLLLISYSNWKLVNRQRETWVSYFPSTLILKPEQSVDHLS